MRKNIIKLIFIIFAVFISNKVIYSQVKFWEPANANGSMKFNVWSKGLVVASNGDLWVASDKGLLLSTDNGDTWVKKNNTPFSWGSMAINPVNGYLFVSITFGGLYRSTDNGDNWECLIDTVFITDILFTESGEMYTGTYKLKYTEGYKIYVEGNVCCYSNDNGNTWIEKSSILPHGFAPGALGIDGTLYAGSISGVYRSTDGGVTWLPPSNYNDMYVHSLTVCDDSSIFAIAPYAGLLKSTDKGINWNKVDNVLDSTRRVYKIISNPVTKDIFVINIVEKSILFEFIIYHYEVCKSDNLGESWKLENNGLPNSIINKFDVLDVNPSTGQMFIGTTYEGVYRTKNYPKNDSEQNE